MQIDFSILSTNEYVPEEIISEDIPDKYFYDKKGEFLLTSIVLQSHETVVQLINFLFQSNSPINEIYWNNNTYLLDLSPHRKNLIDFTYLDNNYERWLEATGRENSMSEYGMLLDFIGTAMRHEGRKYLLAIVYKRSATTT